MKRGMKRKLRVMRRGGFAVLMVVSLVCAGELMKKNEGVMKKWDSLYCMDEGSLNVLFLGSSHVYCTFIPEIFEDSWGCNCY